MFETRGRKNLDAYVDGKLYVVKRPVKLSGGSSFAVVLPKDWLDSVSIGREVKYFLLDVRDTQIIIKPHFESIPDIEEAGL